MGLVATGRCCRWAIESEDVDGTIEHNGRMADWTIGDASVKAKAVKSAVLAGCLMTAVCSSVLAEQREQPNDTVNDKDIKVLEFQELKYPLHSQHAPAESEGVVVVRVKLDDKGKVLDAAAIAGSEILVRDSLANVKTWRFQPNTGRTAVIVYNFRRAIGYCKFESSFFTFENPNFATVTGCRPKSASPSSRVGLGAVTASDRDVEVPDFEDLKYPPLAREARISGIVAVEAELDDKGEVMSAVAISGNAMLIPDCLTNVRKWHFRPNPKRLAVVVYNFRFPCDGVRHNSDTQQQFVFTPPNFATITATAMTVEVQQQSH
jgi:outer membrane biosynthesis protein TonB